MTRIALAAALLFSGAANAMAADMAVKAPPVPVSVLNWAGFYAGGNIGYSWGEARNDWNIFAATPTSTICDPAGFAACLNSSDKARLEGVIGGLQAGYNWINGKYLWGVEGDLQYSDQRRSQTFLGTYPPGVTSGGVTALGTITSNYSQSLQWFGTLRGRVGYGADRWMVYATGGLAVGEVRTDGSNTAVSNTSAAAPNCVPINIISSSCPFGAFSKTETKVGWTLGAGFEGQLWGNWTWKVEYLHVDLGKTGASFATPAGCYGAFILQGNGASAFCRQYVAGNGSVSGSITDEIVRVGVNYHFSGPVVAKY